MDYFLLFLGIFLALFGLIGCFIPVIPGPPLSFLSLLMFQLTRWGGFSTTFMIVMAFGDASIPINRILSHALLFSFQIIFLRDIEDNVEILIFTNL